MDTLFHHDVVVACLGSGSKGNCTYVGTSRQGLLVDCGLSTRQTLLRLEAAGLGDTEILGVLVTHEHSDHVGAARILSDRLTRSQATPVPFHMTRGTRSGLRPKCVPDPIQPVVAGQCFEIGAFRVEPTRVSHDVADPVSYTIDIQGTTVGIVTDLGRSTRLVEAQLARCDIAIVEFNHDLEMLLDGAYPWPLKQRVRGNHGHLSNVQSEALVALGASRRLQHLVLAHLSEDNNTADLALDHAHRGLHRAGVTGVDVSVARQQGPTGPFRPIAAPREPPRRLAPHAARPRAPRPRETEPRGDDQLSLFGVADWASARPPG